METLLAPEIADADLDDVGHRVIIKVTSKIEHPAANVAYDLALTVTNHVRPVGQIRNPAFRSRVLPMTTGYRTVIVELLFDEEVELDMPTLAVLGRDKMWIPFLVEHQRWVLMEIE